MLRLIFTPGRRSLVALSALDTAYARVCDERFLHKAGGRGRTVLLGERDRKGLAEGCASPPGFGCSEWNNLFIQKQFTYDYRTRTSQPVHVASLVRGVF